MNGKIWPLVVIAIGLVSCADKVRIANPSLSSPYDLPISISSHSHYAGISGYDEISFDMDLSRIRSEEIIASNIRFVITSCTDNVGRFTGDVIIKGVTWREALNHNRVSNSDSLQAKIYVPRDLMLANISNENHILTRPLSDRRLCLSLEGYTRSGTKILSNELEIERAWL
ncbi:MULTISPECIES: hypothetical protein [unclassified Brevundimonas]|uniref:hypothetical protein n=1 Tax=unclassified Brevundimonas TaxID=2622653 RepID=UPI0011B0543E|nr:MULTISPECIES: hypothetical protein [unclassified Brevundimonas]